MKISILLTILLISTVTSGSGQTARTSIANPPALPPPKPYRVVQRAANSTLWQGETYRQGPNGIITTNLHHVVELGSGLNHLVDGAYEPSTETIVISSDGSLAMATNGQHKVVFPADLSQGRILLTTPEGSTMQSLPIGLGYDDGSNAVLIAMLTNSVGELVNSNQILYPNAFGVNISLRFTYTHSALEQDVIIQGQLITPASCGLNTRRTKMEVLTAFYGTNDPVQSAGISDPVTGDADTRLTFGTMKMIQGKAFSVGITNKSDGTPIHKRWLKVDGRRFLIEEVPYPQLEPQLRALPDTSGVNKETSTSFVLNRVRSGCLPLPGNLPTTSSGERKPKITRQFASRNSAQKAGVVIDYVQATGSIGDYTFTPGTYFVSGPVYFDDVRLEGGAVIKYPKDMTAFIEIDGELTCQTSPYHPCVFTAGDDDGIGESLFGVWSGYTGSIQGNYAAPALTMNHAEELDEVRICYAQTAISAWSGANIRIKNSQIANCQNGISLRTWSGESIGGATLNNCLLTCGAVALAGGGSGATFNLNGCTIDDYRELVGAGIQRRGPGSVHSVDSIISDIDNFGGGNLSGEKNGFWNTPGTFGDHPIPGSFYPYEYFVPTGGGHYYLADDAFMGVAQSKSDAQKTTQAPQFSYDSIDQPAEFFPCTGGGDYNLGYHYDRMDYVISRTTVNANLTIDPGTIIGWFDGPGLLPSGISITFKGTAANPCALIRCNTVQEEDLAGEGTGISPTASGCSVSANFTRFSQMGFASYFGSAGKPIDLTIKNSEFWNGSISETFSGPVLNLFNCLLDGNSINLVSRPGCPAPSLFLGNCTVHGGSISAFRYHSAQPIYITVKDSAFDGPLIQAGNDHAHVSCNHDAYLSGGRKFPNETANVSPVTRFKWQTGWLGNFYLPNDSPLLNAGDVPAGQLGLYHFTTQTNQVPEGDKHPVRNVDIGYHYVAVDQYRNPLKTLWFGIPDYVADPSGALTSWQMKYFGGLGLDPSQRDANGNTLLFDYQHGLDPGQAGFSFFVADQSFVSNTVWAFVTAPGSETPSSVATLVDNTNFSTATWTDYNSSQFTIDLGTNWGAHNIWVGLQWPGAGTPQAWRKAQWFRARPAVAAGGYHNVALAPNGTVWTWGDNGWGELGDGRWTSSDWPVQTIGLSNIVAISAAEGGMFTLALDNSGTVWSWGEGYWGELGYGNGFFDVENVAGPVAGVSNIITLAAQEYAGLALKSDGTVWDWGYDGYGQLGDGTNEERDYAMPIAGLTSVVAIASGDYHSFALCADGTAWGWGYNWDGQLGIGNTDTQSRPVQLTGLTNAVALSGGYNHSLALLSDGTLMAWGNNAYGQLGNGTNGTGTGSLTPIPVSGLSNVIAIACGYENSLALDKEGRIFLWGYGYQGELGIDGLDKTNMPTLLPGLSNVIAIAEGDYSSLAVTAEGRVFEWGRFWGATGSADYLTPIENDLPELTVSDAAGISVYFANPLANTNTVTAHVSGGPAITMAVLVGNTNFAAAQWMPFDAAPQIFLGTTDGVYHVWFGFQGQNGVAHWTMASVTLDRTPPVVTITAPTDGASFNLARIDVHGTFDDANFKKLTVNGIPAFISGLDFDALNVPLNPEANLITAVAEDLAGNLGSNSIVLVGLTNADGSMNCPVDLQAAPTVGFSPLTVAFQIVSNKTPGIFQQALYDFDGDGFADLVTNNVLPFTHIYTNGEYFPAVTIQTTAGLFSSSGGWNSIDPDRLRINVQAPPILQNIITVTDPVDLKCDSAGNLYVLSRSTATITEYNGSGAVLRSLSSIGPTPCGLDVDTNGNVYVALTGSNQVWKFNPTDTTFQIDTSFGNGGFIGDTAGTSGNGTNSFNAPYDVAVCPDGKSISVSDSGNDRIEQFSTKGVFISAFGTNGTDVGQFHTPKGLTYDSAGGLYIVDSGNNRIVWASLSDTIGTVGSSGTESGQFQGVVNLVVGRRRIYVADSENNRVEQFDLFNSVDDLALALLRPQDVLSIDLSLDRPNAVADVVDFLEEKIYIADTGHNRVLLVKLPLDNPEATWDAMKQHLDSGDIKGASSYFSRETAETYRQMFIRIGAANMASFTSQIPAITPAAINSDRAQYWFDKVIQGQTLTFPIDFVKENGIWKILTY